MVSTKLSQGSMCPARGISTISISERIALRLLTSSSVTTGLCSPYIRTVFEGRLCQYDSNRSDSNPWCVLIMLSRLQEGNHKLRETSSSWGHLGHQAATSCALVPATASSSCFMNVSSVVGYGRLGPLIGGSSSNAPK